MKNLPSPHIHSHIHHKKQYIKSRCHPRTSPPRSLNMTNCCLDCFRYVFIYIYSIWTEVKWNCIHIVDCRMHDRPFKSQFQIVDRFEYLSYLLLLGCFIVAQNVHNQRTKCENSEQTSKQKKNNGKTCTMRCEQVIFIHQMYRLECDQMIWDLIPCAAFYHFYFSSFSTQWI